MGCGASTGGEKTYEVPQGVRVPPLEGDINAIAHAEDLTPRSPSLSTQASRSTKLTTQWDQLSPLLALRSLRQVRAAGEVLGRTPWEETVPGAVLVARLRGFRSLCAAVLAPLPPDSGAVRAQRLSYLLDDLFHRLVQTVRALEGSVVQFTGDTVICCFSADAEKGGRARGVGKEDELRGEADSHCVAACRCSLQLRRQVAAWAKRRATDVADCVRLSCTCAIGVGEVSWVHLNTPPSRTCRDHFRSVLLRGSAIDEANRAMAVALMAPAAGRGAYDGVSIISIAVWEIACDTFATEPLESAEAAAPNLHPWVAAHRKLVRELPSGVATADIRHAESHGLKPPSAVEAGLAEDFPTRDRLSVDNSHKHLLPYLTIARQRSGVPPELRPMIVMAFRIEVLRSSSSGSLKRVQMSTAQLNTFYGLVMECVNSANGVLHHHAMGHLHLEGDDVRAVASAGVPPDPSAYGTAATTPSPTHWCGLAVFGLTAVELDLQRSVRCALRLAQSLEVLPLATQNRQTARGGSSSEVCSQPAEANSTDTRGGGDEESVLVCRGSVALECGPLWLGRLGHRHRYQICVLGEAADCASVEAERHHVLSAHHGPGGMWSQTTGSTTESDDDSTPRPRVTSGSSSISCVPATSAELVLGAHADGHDRTRCKSVCQVHVNDDVKEQLQQQQSPNDANGGSDLDGGLLSLQGGGTAPSDALRFVRCTSSCSQTAQPGMTHADGICSAANVAYPAARTPAQQFGAELEASRSARWRLLP